MELCIATATKTKTKPKAQSSMHQSNYQKCHQNQTNTQINTNNNNNKNNRSNCYHNRDHLKKQHENQRNATEATATATKVLSTKNSSNSNFKNNNPNHNCCSQLHILHLLLLLLLLGPHPALSSPFEHASSSSSRSALLAYYKRAQLRQNANANAYEASLLQQQPPSLNSYSNRNSNSNSNNNNNYQLRNAASFDFEDLSPTASVVSALSSVERLRKRSATSTTTTTEAPPTTRTASISPTASPKAEEKCEPKVLEEVPSEPFYDFTDIAEDAARQFIEFLSNKFPSNAPITIDDQTRAEVSRRANGIASYALNEEDTLLAFAIAAPGIHTVVVKFRDNVTIPPDQVHNKAYLGSYWRELGAAWNSSDGTQEWGVPFRDCNLLTGRWLWPFRISFTEHRIKIVAAAFIAADEDVCNDALEEVFGRRHGCDRNTTFCLLTENKPAVTRDVYTCLCRESYYLPNSTLQGFRGDLVELSEGFDNYSCIPCPGSCSSCDQHGVCLFQEEEVFNMDACLRLLVAIVLGACILCCIVLGVIVFRQRKCKAIASGMWTVLETILLGIVLLYSSVAVHFFPASTERCLLEPWLRELGFITCYGAIILKLYRHLVDFRTRKAHRWVLRDVDLLKYLGTMVFAVLCYMSAFTASSLDLLKGANLDSLRDAHTNTCYPMNWELVTQASEVSILCFGLHLSFASRNANTQFRERQFLVTALTLEFLVSTSFYLMRFFYLPEMSPSAILLALFVRSQLTNTFALGLIFVPKLWYQHKQVRSLAYDLSIRLPVDAFKGTSHDAGQRLGGGYAGLCLGDPDIGELTISEMSPEDIRAELKRLYTQLEILKNKTLRQDNPHISKRRGGRKAGHRRFSLQKKGSKDKALSAKHRSNKHHQDIEITEAEPSRTPEDSVCSAEGPTDTYAEISGISHSMLSHSMVSHSVVSHSK
ncbi:probable G-protein coupled receptor 158 [Scaptodrosophila lebanonensis]|uniref:Probable G-protein coupled receptor 158 n=1 Tax=Drosophila lebanonensis TaxID=7225 RepID=A0A6J2U3D2_DROLE|nr:probable G-protein coupled receptor 158 [Scaptodrosophila lebanonensis]